jgi:hypothetical protein
MGVPMKWEIARIFVVGTGGSGFCAEAAPSGVIGFFMAVAPYSSFGSLLLNVSVLDAAVAMPMAALPEKLARFALRVFIPGVPPQSCRPETI